MIDQEANNIAIGFSEFWNKLTVNSPRYNLDFSWYTIGVLDLIFFQYPNKQDFDERDRLQIFGASAYIGLMAYNSWKQYDNNSIVSLKTINSGLDIEICIQNGKYLEDKSTYKINITKTLTEILRSAKDPFPFYEKFQLKLHNSRIVSRFCVGLISGLSPYGVGKWSNLTEKDFLENIKKVVLFLSESSASSYSKIYPQETIAQDYHFYTNFLILPPVGYSESIFCSRASHGFLSYFKKNNIGFDSLKKVAINLSRSTNETYSYIGFIILLALEEKKDNYKLKLLAESLGDIKLELIPCIKYVKSLLDQNFIEIDFELLSAYNFFPNLVIDINEITKNDPNFAKLIIENKNELISENYNEIKSISNPEILLQRAYLACKNKNFDFAETCLESLVNSNLQPKYSTLILLIKSYIFEGKQDYLSSFQLLKDINLSVESNVQVNTKILENKALFLYQEGLFSECSMQIEPFIKTMLINLKLINLLLSCYSKLEDQHKYDNLLSIYQQSVTFDFELFKKVLNNVS